MDKQVSVKNLILGAIIILLCILLYPRQGGASSYDTYYSPFYRVDYYDGESIYSDVKGVQISILGFKIYDNTR
ncbi:MAG: hypothetical protein IJP13_03725 [Lachnospiraceae bacterium]|nr:hypothetical protein [Lachnospiraceae bacterium]